MTAYSGNLLCLSQFLLPGHSHLLNEFFRLMQFLLQLRRLHRLLGTMGKKCKNQLEHHVTDIESDMDSFMIRDPPNPFSHLGLRELNLELLHLFSELSDDPSVGVFIHHGVVDNSLGSVGVTERGQSFFIVISCWTHCGYHGCLAVAAKVVLNTQTCHKDT